ncbi:MAG: hypothetical protein K9J21_11880 [Bacteroidales bacterium]|nr:hypothetical protein [Bacteroidales bacterium]
MIQNLIHYFSPYSINGNIGEAYNLQIELVPNDDDWICIIDQDVMLLGEKAGHQIAEIIQKHDDVAVFTSYTNRVGTKAQRYPGMYNIADLRAHREISLKLQERNYSKIKMLNRGISGHLMLFQKKTWEDVGKFNEEGILQVDYDFTRKVTQKGGKIALMQGVYATHYYRLIEGRRHTKHLS